MDNKKSSDNVIQFPGRKKESEIGASHIHASSEAPAKKAAQKTKRIKSTSAATVLAIILATAAVNQFAFRSTRSTSMASNGTSETTSGRGLASVDSNRLHRNAQWEKNLAERLAAAKPRQLASLQVGRPATTEEKLRWGILEEKYTITYKQEDSEIQSILLQDSGVAPAYILDRMKFLKEFGSLLESDFESAKLKSIDTTADKTLESYMIFDSQGASLGEARFELDRHKRLLSLKVEPEQI